MSMEVGRSVRFGVWNRSAKCYVQNGLRTEQKHHLYVNSSIRSLEHPAGYHRARTIAQVYRITYIPPYKVA
jgi:hypothetical protein